jgi:hypothetical protein
MEHKDDCHRDLLAVSFGALIRSAIRISAGRTASTSSWRSRPTVGRCDGLGGLRRNGVLGYILFDHRFSARPTTRPLAS